MFLPSKKPFFPVFDRKLVNLGLIKRRRGISNIARDVGMYVLDKKMKEEKELQKKVKNILNSQFEV